MESNKATFRDGTGAIKMVLHLSVFFLQDKATIWDGRVWPVKDYWVNWDLIANNKFLAIKPSIVIMWLNGF